MSENQKKIWITGASSGIGKAVAEKFAAEGWKVAVSARRIETLNKMSKNKNIYAYPLDVTDLKETEITFKKIIEDFKDIDVCLFGSAIYIRSEEKDINIDNIKKTIEVNFLGSVNCVKVVEDYFKKKKKGIISLISSIAAYRGLPGSTGYGPSKAALTNFVESIYFDFKKFNVKIKLISPGFIKTPMTDTNEFPMPFIKSPIFAAEKIYKGLIERKIFEIHFPIQLTYILKFLRIVPYKIYLLLIDKFIKR